VETILIATDGSDESERAVELGLELAAEQDAQVVLVHVLPPEAWTWQGPAPIYPRAVFHEPDEDTSVLRPALRLAAERGVPATAELVSGDPVAEIVKTAARFDADLIVLGSRGLGRVKAALLGSVSRGVLAEAKRSVLVVREQRAAAVPA
jgi:nucleotide-binding universal stress UspA family protein